MMLRCLVVDDEPLAVELLEDLIQKVPTLSLVGKCYHALDALQFVQTNAVDVIFLDINMPRLTGLEFAGLIPPHTKIIFTTAYGEYAVESYEKNATDYLVKPITLERFLKAVNKLTNQLVSSSPDIDEVRFNESESKIFIKTGKKIIQVDLLHVTHIEGMGDYAVFHYNGEKVMLGRTLKELETLLPSFIQRIHLSFFVNLNHIKKIEDNHVSVGEIKIPISSKYRDEFQKIINSRLL